MASISSSVDKIERGADDAVGVDTVVAIHVVERTDLPEPADAECAAADSVDTGQECQGVRVAVEDGHHWRGAPGGEHAVKNPGRALGQPTPGLQGLEKQAGAGDAHDVGGYVLFGETV